ncbi:MAG: methylglyoxal synthase [SAR324 cluster bacterium]|nr:methylglyoxal synthase [SAR324 cluster bacterium]
MSIPIKNKTMHARKRIAMVAHDHKKQELLSWALQHKTMLEKHELFSTGTTGKLLSQHLNLPITGYHSGPLGGDQQIGAQIVEGHIDFLIFFWDPLSPQPHDPDVKALLRIASVWNIPIACNLASLDFLTSSPFMNDSYERQVPDFDAYLAREIPMN